MKAYNAGEKAAAEGLGELYYYGYGVSKNLEKAKAWFNEAVNSESDEVRTQAKDMLEKIAESDMEVTFSENAIYAITSPSARSSNRFSSKFATDKRLVNCILFPIIILMLFALAIGVQLLGLFDIFGWLNRFFILISN